MIYDSDTADIELAIIAILATICSAALLLGVGWMIDGALRGLGVVQ